MHIMKILSHLILEKDVKAECKGKDEEEKDAKELPEGVQYLANHNDVDSNHRQLSEKQQQVHPGKKHCKGSKFHLPFL